MRYIEFGNVRKKPNGERGWIVGHFIEKESPFHTNDFEIKWADLKMGDAKPLVGTNKVAKTLNILIKGKLRVEFPQNEQEFDLNNEGDYLYFDANVGHSWVALEDSLVISIRWPSLPGDQQ